MKRWLWILLLSAVTLAGIVYGLRDQPVPVEAASVSRGPLRVTVEEEGKTRLRSRYIVSAPVAGFMSRITLRAGDVVHAGQVLTRITPAAAPLLDPRSRNTAEARVGVAEASLDAAQVRVRVAEAALEVAQARVQPLEQQQRAAQVDLDYWRREQAREEQLVRSGDLPTQRLDRTRAEVARAEAAVEAARRNVEAARKQVENAAAEVAAARAQLSPQSAEVAVARAQVEPAPTRTAVEAIAVRIPASGRVIRVIQESEGVVAPGAPLIEIGDAHAIEVAVEVLSPDAVKLAPGTRVVLTGWGGPQPLEARLRVIEPGGFTKISALGVEEQRVRVVADITSPETEWRSLGDGYRVEAAFVLWEQPDVLQVPANALFRHEDGWAVFVIEQGVARRRKVQVGQRNGLAAQILSGLEVGQTVIAHPDETVEDGKPVTVR
jgi:HlyD family secretion protein